MSLRNYPHRVRMIRVWAEGRAWHFGIGGHAGCQRGAVLTDDAAQYLATDPPRATPPRPADDWRRSTFMLGASADAWHEIPMQRRTW